MRCRIFELKSSIWQYVTWAPQAESSILVENWSQYFNLNINGRRSISNRHWKHNYSMTFNVVDILEVIWYSSIWNAVHGPLTRYLELQVAHAPGMPGTYSPAADFKGNLKFAIPAYIMARARRTCRDACRDRLPAVTWETFPAFPAHAHVYPQFYVSGKRPIDRKNTSVIIVTGPFSGAFCEWSILAALWLMHAQVKTQTK